MPRKKKQPVKRQRHTPYERALERASARLTKAIAERDACAERLRVLTVEIPRLQDMIAGIERFMGVVNTPKVPGLPGMLKPKFREQIEAINAIPLEQRQDLTVDDLPDENDSLLPDVAGKELLP